MIEIMLAVGSQAEAVAMALIRWYFQWAGAMGRVISARWLSLPQRVYSNLFENANTRKHVHEHNCSSVRVFLSILAHLAHLAQSFFSDFKCDK